MFLKELKGEKIEMNSSQEGKKSNWPLLYDDAFKYERVATISEPFLTPMIQHVFSSIAGHGNPDYSDEIALIIHKKYLTIFQ
jgi:hypothetical protein